MFVTAIALAVLVPLVLTGVAVARVCDEPQQLPVERAAARGLVDRAPRVRTDFWSGFSTGVLCGWLLPPIVRVVAGRSDAPAWTAIVVTAAFVLIPLALYAALRPRGRYALGMAAGAALIGAVAPLVFIVLFSATGFLVGWF